MSDKRISSKYLKCVVKFMYLGTKLTMGCCFYGSILGRTFFLRLSEFSIKIVGNSYILLGLAPPNGTACLILLH